ncbi:M16 family metallopeptidase [Agilicoccus flavus]|uniref:M16 family metallopeptidase n=1 Tax=Agilicoccus flavus TaxID=2775968 RepID=UPI001CF639B7|nr:insulinase family protein [Agilicoccus flavus]
MSTARPSVAPAPAWSFPTPARSRLATGLDVLAYELAGQHVTSMRLVVPMPLRAEPAGREGVGTILARTLDEGTARRTADEMAVALERSGVALRAGLTDHGLVVDVDVPRRRLRVAAELLLECLAEPAFGPTEVARHVRLRRSEIEQEHADPASAAAIAFLAAHYPQGERFSRPAAGPDAGVAAITPDDVHAHHRRFVRPDGATIAIAGEGAREEGVDVLADVLGRWAGPLGDAPSPGSLLSGETPGGTPVPEKGPDAGGIVVVDRPGSVQSELYLGCAGPDRHVEGGWAPFPVLAMIVGGAPQARLDAVLREEKGYTYGMRCGFRPRPGAGLFVTSGSVRADATVDAVRLTYEILERAGEGFTDAETGDAVAFVSQTAPGRYATADAVAAEAAARCLDGTGPEETDRVLARTRTLTAARLRDAFREHVSGEWTTVVVGDADAIVPGLQALGRGPVRVSR